MLNHLIALTFRPRAERDKISHQRQEILFFNATSTKQMRLPRRVPWASIAELDQVCSWIYTDERDLETNLLAINRVRVG